MEGPLVVSPSRSPEQSAIHRRATALRGSPDSDVPPVAFRQDDERIFWADDHEIVRQGLRLLSNGGVEVIGEAANGQEAIACH